MIRKVCTERDHRKTGKDFKRRKTFSIGRYTIRNREQKDKKVTRTAGDENKALTKKTIRHRTKRQERKGSRRSIKTPGSYCRVRTVHTCFPAHSQVLIRQGASSFTTGY